jgi:predicted helicase
MSRHFIEEYLAEIDRLRRYSGTGTEGVISEAFKSLLKACARQRGLHFIPQYQFQTAQGALIRPDGTILHDLRVPLGYWEAKDAQDDLDAEIARKLRRGYPQDNIVFEDSREAVLIQDRREAMRCSLSDVPALDELLGRFFGYERREIGDFRKAVEQFQRDMPAVLEALRAKIADAHRGNAAFRAKARAFLDHARDTIDPGVSEADVREMLIQHILTEDIFAHVFDDRDFHRHNNVARELYALEETFFRGAVKRDTLRALEPYYATIRSTAALISGHSEKQRFLKAIYERFYRIYDPKKADRLGVFYTPEEVVRFMVKATDRLVQLHFGRGLIDEDVEILDPATGTGTFVCELLEHFRGQPDKLARKYKQEIHANEVAILAYYVANLNIEATYAGIAGQYAEFPSLCFVDTLDNVAGLAVARGHQHDLLAALSAENVERVRRQNGRRISVIIGNPPYNSNQQNENDENRNRAYPHIDRRIADTYIRLSRARKTKAYDPYARFFRWATDRLGDDGVVAFVTNNSFAKKKNYDGFRRAAAEHFTDIYVIDFKGDARSSGEVRRREGANIFDDQVKVGIAISFMVRDSAKTGCTIRYAAVPDAAKLEEKQAFISGRSIDDIPFRTVTPSEAHDWVDIPTADWSAFLPVASQEARAARSEELAHAVFRTYALGVSTNRDEWLYSASAEEAGRKAAALVEAYDRVPADAQAFPPTLKWSRNLKRRLAQGRREPFDPGRIRRANYRPFTARWLYQSRLFVDEPGGLDAFFPVGAENVAICFSDVGSRSGVCVLAVDGPADLHFGAAIDAYQQVARWRYGPGGDRVDNVTDWALERMREAAPAGPGEAPLTKDDVFAYVYAALYDPAYRRGFAANLRNAFPRIPLRPDARRWAAWGRRLLELHLGYGTADPWPLRRVEPPAAARRPGLRSRPEEGAIDIDGHLRLEGVPPEAWDFVLGNRSALDWVLDQHRPRAPRDPALAALLGRRGADARAGGTGRDGLADLLARIVTVSVGTAEVQREMEAAQAADADEEDEEHAPA